MTKMQDAPQLAGRCGPCASGSRNRYFRGKLLTVSDYQAEQGYMIGRRRLVNRAMLGWGVVDGFALSPAERGLSIGAGFALDPCGREVVACEAVTILRAADVVWLTEGQCGLEPTAPPPEPHDSPYPQPQPYEGQDAQAPPQQGYAKPPAAHYLLAAHYAEQPIDGVRIDDGCGSASCEANHLCETVVYTLRPVGECPDGLQGCRDPRFPRSECTTSDEEQAPAPVPERRPITAGIDDRGTQQQLCGWSEAWLHGFDACKPCRLCRVGELWLDPQGGVPLACVTIGHDCGEAYISGVVEVCRPRRLARPNELLFDLIRGCDLTRIQDVGWGAWLQPPFRVPYEHFAGMFHEPQGDAPSDTGLWVCFSGPVQVDSLTPDVITVTLVQRCDSDGLRAVRRLPIPRLAVAPPSPGDPPGTTRMFRPFVNAAFWVGEVYRHAESGFERDTRVEIEIRCDFIVDHLGQMVAGGGRYPPSRGTTPGGRFLSCFTVEARPANPINTEA